MEQRPLGDRRRFVCAILGLVLAPVGAILCAWLRQWVSVAISIGLAVWCAYMLYVRHTDFDRWLSWDRRSRKRERRKRAAG
jgi:fatty acid desaturase